MAELHHADAVAHGHRFRLIVGDVDGGRRFARFFQLLMQIGNADPHRGAQLGVKVGERFVEQEDVRFFDDRPAHRHALRLAAGELARQAIEQFFQFENFRRFFHLSVDLRLRQLAQLQAEGEVFAHRHMRIEGVVLEHHRDATGFRRQVVDDFVPNPHLAAADGLQARQHAQGGRFGAAGGADDHHKFAIGNLQVDTMHRFKPVGVDFFQFVENHFSHDISLLTFDSAAGHALHEVALSQEEDNDGRQNGDARHCQNFVPRRAFRDVDRHF